MIIFYLIRKFTKKWKKFQVNFVEFLEGKLPNYLYEKFEKKNLVQALLVTSWKGYKLWVC
jgi:hypothetical protein